MFKLYAPAMVPVQSPFEWDSQRLSGIEAALQRNAARRARAAASMRVRRLAARRALASEAHAQ